MVEHVQESRWFSVGCRVHGTRKEQAIIGDWPLPRPRQWRRMVNQSQTEAELQAVRRCVHRSQSYGSDNWVKRTAVTLGLESTLRPRGRPKKTVIKELMRCPLSIEARDADILEDAVVELGKTSRVDARPDHSIRLITIKTTPHIKRGKYKGGSTGPGSDGVLRIATNLLDIPAEIIALIYRFRWTIEIFFRFFKHVLGCRHLLSRSENGIEIQMYCAIIACMLISLWTGRKPTLRTYEMVCYYLIGLADLEELTAHLENLKSHDA